MKLHGQLHELSCRTHCTTIYHSIHFLITMKNTRGFSPCQCRGYRTWANTFLSPYLHPISCAFSGKTLHQCGVHIGLYTLSSRWRLCVGCCIAKGVSERCIARLLLTLSCIFAAQNADTLILYSNTAFHSCQFHI